MCKSLVILGTGGNALDILDIVDALRRVGDEWHVSGFLDDLRPRGREFAGYPVLGPLADAAVFADGWFVNSIGSDRSHRRRAEIVAATGIHAARFATLVHPSASVSGRATLGHGSYACAGVSVAGGVRVRDHVHLGAGCVIGHDTVIEDHAMIAPGAVLSGFVRVGRGAYVGARAAIRQRAAIGEEALVGIGTVVLNDVADRTTVVGNPARPLVRIPAFGTTQPVGGSSPAASRAT